MSEAEAFESLDDVISGNETVVEAPTGEPEAQVDSPAEVEQEATNTEPEAEPKVEAEATPKQDSPPESDVDTEWTKAMALDERQKRQEWQRKYEELAQAQQKRDENPLPDVFENQEAFAQSLLEKVEATRQQDRIELSQEIMRSLHEDYDQREAEFIAMAKENPILVQEMNKAGNPAKFAYEAAMKAEKLRSLENVDEMEARIRQEIEAKVRAEIEGNTKQAAENVEKKRQSIPPSLTDAGGKAGFDSDAPESIDDILG